MLDIWIDQSLNASPPTEICWHPRTTFGDLPRDHLEIEVTCEQCGSVGLPTIGKQRRWPDRLADRARKLR
jgi:hypothetical protein